MAHAAIATIGHDRPGLVSDITAIAKSHGVNIADSRMTVLGGEFAVLMEITAPEPALDAFRQAMETLCDGKDLAFVFRLTQARQLPEAVRPYTATVVAMDHPGIVHGVAEFFSQRNINIRDLNTSTSPAAHTGTPVFSVSLIAEIPSDIKVHTLREQFAEFCMDADLDGSLDPAPI